MEFKMTMEFAPGAVSGRLAGNDTATKPSLLFLNISNPSDTRHPRVQRLVRSHVTVQQHDRLRCKPVRGGEDGRPDEKDGPRGVSTANVVSQGDDSPGRRGNSEPDEDPAPFTFLAVDPADEHTFAMRKKVHSHVARRQHQRRRAADRRRYESLRATSNQPKGAPKVWKAKPMPLTPSGDPSDWLDVHLRELGMSMLEVLDHYLWIIREQSPEFEGQNPQYRGWGETLLYPLMISHQTTLGGTAIMVSSHMRFLKGETHVTPQLLRLRSTILRRVQAAINDRTHQLDNTTLLAVALMASYEAIYGTKANYTVHMEGLVAMIRLRGGLDKLGQDGYVAHCLLWFDANASKIAGSQPYCDKLEGWQSIRFPEAKKELFHLGAVRPSDASDNDASLVMDEADFSSVR